MSRLLVAVDAGPLGPALVAAADALVPALADRVEVVTVGFDPTSIPADDHDVVALEGDRDRAGDALLAAAGAADVTAVVVGLRSVDGGPRPAGHVASRLITASPVPVVVVPPPGEPVGEPVDPLRRVLLPLEGAGDLATATAEMMAGLAARGTSVDTIHVFDRTSTPMFWDRWHDEQLFVEQFSDQSSPVPGRPELRVGDVARQILDAALANRSTLIVLEWKRRLGAARGQVVNDLLCHTTVPLLLLQAEPDEPGEGGEGGG